MGVVRVHHHIDSGVDSERQGFLLVGGHMVADEEVVDVGPVGYEHTVPAEFFLHPAAQKNGICVSRDAVYGSRVHHGGKGACTETFKERGEEFLAEVVLHNVCGSAVLAGCWHAVGHEVLQAHRGMECIHVIGVVTLDGAGFHRGHHCLQVGVLAEALPQTGPARLAAEVHNGRKHPRNACSAGFIGHGFTHYPCIFRLEGGGDVHFLGEKRSVRKIGRSMDHIQAIDTGYAEEVHRHLLNLTHHFKGLNAAVGVVMHSVENGAHLVVSNHIGKLGGIDGLVGVVLDYADIQLDHLAHFLPEAHAGEHLLNLRLNGGIAGNNGLGCLFLTGRKG